MGDGVAGANGDLDDDNDANAVTVASIAATAAADAYKENANVANSVKIVGFGAGDTITVSNASTSAYSFSSVGTDLKISYNNAGVVNDITLAGVVEAGTFIGSELDAETARIVGEALALGYRSIDTCELLFEDYRVPVENLVGGENRGVKVVMSGLDLERAMISPICLGIAERAFALALDYAKQRKQFGRSISDFQMVQAKLADMYTRVESMRLYTYQVLRAANVIGEDEGGRGEIHKLTAAGVLYVAETMNQVLNDAVQVHGGTGYIWESEVNRLYRSIKLLEIGAGTTEVNRGRKIITNKPTPTIGYTKAGTPIRCGSCEVKIKIASALTNPTITLRGMKRINLATPRTLSATWKMPARMTVAMK